MALDRQSIERRDFPIGRRGYEPEDVDAHLARIADAVDELRRRSAPAAPDAGGGPASVAQAASEQVRAIVEAAEASAADIVRTADADAARIREEADADARRTRDEAVAQSQDHVDRVRRAATQMLQRVDAMEAELTGVIEALRTGGNRLTTDLSLLQTGMGDLYDAAGRPRPPATRVVESVPAVVVPEPVLDADEPDQDVLAEPELEPAAQPDAEAAPAAPAAAGAQDVEGARIVALEMALSGRARAETDRYLADHYDLSDRDALLDEVYASVQS